MHVMSIGDFLMREFLIGRVRTTEHTPKEHLTDAPFEIGPGRLGVLRCERRVDRHLEFQQRERNPYVLLAQKRAKRTCKDRHEH
jgi:hypothetical protein